MAPRQRFTAHTVDESPPIMAVESSSTSTSPTNNTVTTPLLLADNDNNNNNEDSSSSSPLVQPLRPSRESSFSDESSEISLTSTMSCSKSQPLKTVATAYPNAATTTTDDASEIAREQHDFFNLIALIPLITATNMNWNFHSLYKGYGMQASWEENYFWAMWTCCIVYFFVDLVWVSMIPHCVKSPGTIVKHHLVAMVYMTAPVIYPEYRWEMGACLWVEINTWFLILRRVIYKRRHVLPTILSDAVSIAFYTSWIVIRIFIYPYLLKSYLDLAIEAVIRTQVYFHFPMLFIPVHFVLCVLNLKWSYDLFNPIIRGWFAPPNAAGTSSGVSSGL